MTRSEAIVTAVTNILYQRREMLADVSLRALNLEAHVGKDGLIRTVLLTPRFVRGGGALRGRMMLDAAVVHSLDDARALLDDPELAKILIEARLERDGRARVFLVPTYARLRDRVMAYD